MHEALRQRIIVHYNYGGLSDQEAPDYICHKLETMGGAGAFKELPVGSVKKFVFW